MAVKLSALLWFRAYLLQANPLKPQTGPQLNAFFYQSLLVMVPLHNIRTVTKTKASHVAQVDIRAMMCHVGPSLSSQPCCLCFPSAEITDKNHHIWL